jgi:hypothetical protein
VRVRVEFFDNPISHPGNDAAFIDTHSAAGKNISVAQIGEGKDIFCSSQSLKSLSNAHCAETDRGTRRKQHEFTSAYPF